MGGGIASAAAAEAPELFSRLILTSPMIRPKSDPVPWAAAGLVASTRGKQGGYRLTKAAEEYTVGEILRVTEGSLAPVSCLDEEHRCENCDDCVTIEIWQNVLDAINEVVDSITLSYLVEKQKTKKTCCNKG